MATDYHTNYVNTLRQALSTLLSPFYYALQLPATAVYWVSAGFREKTSLITENQALNSENLLLKARLQRFDDLWRENERLRRLLGATPSERDHLLVAQVIAVDLAAHSSKLVINKGSRHSVEEGLPVLDSAGVVGQIYHVGMFNSIVVLITDNTHMLPVQISRTGLRTLAEGNGLSGRLELLYLPKTTDIREGDVLVTSGLGGKFPPGYPVGEISHIRPDTGEAYTHAEVTPYAQLDRNRELLLLWPKNEAVPTEETSPSREGAS